MNQTDTQPLDDLIQSLQNTLGTYDKYTNRNTLKRPTFDTIPEFETAFKRWGIEETGRRPNTVKWYWTAINDLPYIELHTEDQYDLTGTLNKYLNTSAQRSKTNIKTALSALIDFLFYLTRADLQGREYEILREKRTSIKANLEIEDENKTATDMEHKLKNNYIHPDDLVDLLAHVDAERAKFWYLLYAGGLRIGELKRLTSAHLKPNRGGYGAVYVPAERSKSPVSRDVLFLSETPIAILDELGTGTWIDENGEQWDDVFFPAFTSQTEYYHLKQKWCKKLGVGPRTVHSFRHTRISHLVHDPGVIPVNDVKEFVQKRSGHSSADMTDNYIETTFDRDPITLETYCTEQEIDILEVIHDTPQ